MGAREREVGQHVDDVLGRQPQHGGIGADEVEEGGVDGGVAIGFRRVVRRRCAGSAPLCVVERADDPDDPLDPGLHHRDGGHEPVVEGGGVDASELGQTPEVSNTADAQAWTSSSLLPNARNTVPSAMPAASAT